jgi:hypothetical protein
MSVIEARGMPVDLCFSLCEPVGEYIYVVSRINSFAELIRVMSGKANWQVRHAAFMRMLEIADFYEEGRCYVMLGAKPTVTELQTANKLADWNYYVVFPSDGQIKEVRNSLNLSGQKRPDVFIVDKKTFRLFRADLKTAGNPSMKTVVKQFVGGAEQAEVVILDISGTISKRKLMMSIRNAFIKASAILLLNYHGKWYQVDRAKAFDKKWLDAI